MSILDVLRSGVKIANTITRPLQVLVKYERAIGQDQNGPTFAVAVYLHAIVDYKVTLVRARDGQMTAAKATITLLDVNEVVAATSGKGIGNNDVFTLPDGSNGSALGLSGFVDAGTGTPIATMVMQG